MGKPTEVTKDTELSRVSATFSKKVQVKQYEPVGGACSVTEYCKKDEKDETYDRLYEWCKERVLAKIEAELEEDKKNPVDEDPDAPTKAQKILNQAERDAKAIGKDDVPF